MKIVGCFKLHTEPILEIRVGRSGEKIATLGEDYLIEIVSLPEIIC